MIKKLLTLSSISACCFGANLTHLSDYLFLDRGKHVQFAGEYSEIGKASSRRPGFEDTHLRYADWDATAYFGSYYDKCNAFCGQLAYTSMRLDWKENPRFTKKDFNDFITSLAFVSTAVPKWRWVLDLGMHMDTEFFNLRHTFWSGMMWGRLQYQENLAFHFGFLGQKGVKSTYLLPIIGLDWFIPPNILLNVVFPLDLAAYVYFNPYWKIALKYRSFGGWYRANHRLAEDQPTPGGLVTQSFSGVDLGLYYDRNGTGFVVYGGGDFGGWIQVTNKDESNKRYYKFGGAPYFGAKLNVAF